MTLGRIVQIHTQGSTVGGGRGNVRAFWTGDCSNLLVATGKRSESG